MLHTDNYDFSLWTIFCSEKWGCQIDIDPKSEKKKGQTWQTQFSLLWSVRSTLTKPGPGRSSRH